MISLTQRNLNLRALTFTKVDDETYKLTGDLTLRDTLLKITLDVNYGGSIVDPWVAKARLRDKR